MGRLCSCTKTAYVLKPRIRIDSKRKEKELKRSELPLNRRKWLGSRYNIVNTISWRTRENSFSMSPEQEVNPDRLEFRIRNSLQAALIQRMQGKKISREEVLAWVEKNGERISNIIDDPHEIAIRDAAKVGDFKRAAELLEARLREIEPEVA